MRNQIRVKERGGSAEGLSLYDQDFARWVEEQVAALRAGDAAALDIANLIEELEGLTKRGAGARLAAQAHHGTHAEAAVSAAARQPKLGRHDREWSRGDCRHPRAEPQPASNLARPDEEELPARRLAGEPRYATASRPFSGAGAIHSGGGPRRGLIASGDRPGRYTRDDDQGPDVGPATGVRYVPYRDAAARGQIAKTAHFVI
jgi:Domain of unknown function DUF29